MFPDGIVPHDIEERITQYKLADESVRHELNRSHWQDNWDKLTERCLARYIRENIEALRHLDNNT